MPIIDGRRGQQPVTALLSNAQTGNGASTNVVDRGASHKGGTLRITAVVGSTPTVTVQPEVSLDGVNWSAATFADSSTPNTNGTAPFTITTAGVTQKLIKQPTPWRYFRCTYSANTNVTITAELLYQHGKTLT